MPSKPKPLRVAVAGCGSIGVRHLRNLRALGVTDLHAVDPDGARRERAARETAATPHAALKDAIRGGVDAVLVTTPSHLHLSPALEAIEAGATVFVEKPLHHEWKGVPQLLRAARKSGRPHMVACNMRFHHGPRTLHHLLQRRSIGRVVSAHLDAGQYLPDWRPNEDYRTWYSASKARGGGVILDGIHEIDYARWLLGEVTDVDCRGGRRSDLEIDVEDTADLLLGFGDVTATLHIDYLQRAYSRTCKIIGDEGTLLWDIQSGVRHYSAKKKTWQDHSPPADYAINDMYVQEAHHFLSCLRDDATPLCTLEDGARVLQIALAAKKSMNTHARVKP